MADIKPDEISAILRQQLSNTNVATELEEVGTVLQVGDGIARIFGLEKAMAGELVEFYDKEHTMGMVLNLEGHIDKVAAVAISADGDAIAAGCADGTIQLWQLGSGKKGATLRGHVEGVTALAFAPTGKTLVSAGRDGLTFNGTAVAQAA